jgi:hypothetical protein
MTKRIVLALLVFALFSPGCEKTTVEGPSGKKLTVVKPSDATIRRGSNDKVNIMVTRDNFKGPVTVRFEDLPKGVSVAENGGDIEDNSRTFVLVAADNADLVTNHTAKVTVSGPEGMSASEQFKITIKDKA